MLAVRQLVLNSTSAPTHVAERLIAEFPNHAASLLRLQKIRGVEADDFNALYANAEQPFKATRDLERVVFLAKPLTHF